MTWTKPIQHSPLPSGKMESFQFVEWLFNQMLVRKLWTFSRIICPLFTGMGSWISVSFHIGERETRRDGGGLSRLFLIQSSRNNKKYYKNKGWIYENIFKFVPYFRNWNQNIFKIGFFKMSRKLLILCSTIMSHRKCWLLKTTTAIYFLTI